MSLQCHMRKFLSKMALLFIQGLFKTAKKFLLSKITHEKSMGPNSNKRKLNKQLMMLFPTTVLIKEEMTMNGLMLISSMKIGVNFMFSLILVNSFKPTPENNFTKKILLRILMK